ncbi:hypothetical protein M1M11_23970 [Pseudomonas azerbaijanoccidens]|uniref:hypothetical protein n=1 Tax=Pseudomonas azerbaijanoccidentalis TaxID=2842347 RepID=UPI00200B1DD6|nr:hypothetical protein [Pseudomonas azerbaijanoccidentalis]MCK8667942.1 hypothetical protein [Pseudomonas azerbaijanoccidentalis]
MSGCTLSEAAKAEEFSLSENLLAGFTRLEKAEDYPDTLTLPQGWATALTKMYARTTKTNREVATCLALSADISEENAKLRDARLVEYGALIRKRLTLPAQEFADQRAALRKRIEEVSVEVSEWSAGTINEGKQWEGSFNGAQCQGGIQGLVHTHPLESDAVHSDKDLQRVMSDNEKLDLVVHKDRVCVFIRDNTNPADSAPKQWELTSGFLSSPAPTSIPKTLESVAAGIVGAFNAAYYCGTIGKPLKKIAPAVEQENNPRVILGAKGLLVILKNSDPVRNISLNFPFTPVLDSAFLAAVAKTVDEPAGEVKTWSGKKIFERLSAVLTKEESAAFGNGIQVPDFRSGTKGRVERSFSCVIQKSVDCEVDRHTTGEYGVVEAHYVESKNFYRIAELQSGDSGRYLLSEVEVGSGTSLKGQGKLIGNQLEMSGPAHFKSDGYEIKGNFDNWVPEGNVQYRSAEDKEWRTGRFENGHLKKTSEVQ